MSDEVLNKVADSSWHLKKQIFNLKKLCKDVCLLAMFLLDE